MHSLSWNCILSFTISYLQKNKDQCIVMHGRTLARILVNLDNFIGVIDMAVSIDVLECAVMACDHFAFLYFAFCSHSYCFEHFTKSPHLHFKLTYLHCMWLLHWHLQWHLENVCTGLQRKTLTVTKISYIYVCLNPNTYLVSSHIYS